MNQENPANENILVETDGGVGVIRLNRPKALNALNDALIAEVIDLKVLIAANIVPAFTKKAKIIQSGLLNKAVVIKGISVTIGAKASIEAAGGTIEA